MPLWTNTGPRSFARSTGNPSGTFIALHALTIRINMDIVYTLSKKYTGEELRYSLRSLVKIPHDKVFIVGGCPEWVKNVIHIPTEQTGTKYKNTTNNLIKACNDSRISKDFILMNDDFFFLENIIPKELNLHNGPVDKSLERYHRLIPKGSPYVNGMEQTKAFIESLGIKNPLSYELHVPFVINKKRFLKMFKLPGVMDIPCLHKRTLYGNLYLSGGKEIPDVKIFGRKRLNLVIKEKFVSCDDFGFWRMVNFLISKFPEKSDYEI